MSRNMKKFPTNALHVRTVHEELHIVCSLTEPRQVIAILRAERVRQRITQEQLASTIGISSAQISTIEKGENAPRASTISRYAEALGLEVRYTILEKA